MHTGCLLEIKAQYYWVVWNSIFGFRFDCGCFRQSLSFLHKEHKFYFWGEFGQFQDHV
jgi:hypothetical protein